MDNEPQYEIGSPNVPEYEIKEGRQVFLEPVDNMTVNELVEYSVEDFLIIMGGNPCLWCNGYLLGFSAVNAEVFDRCLSRGLRWYRRIDYAVCPKFTSTLKTSENVTIPVINYCNSDIGTLAASFIKDYRKNAER